MPTRQAVPRRPLRLSDFDVAAYMAIALVMLLVSAAMFLGTAIDDFDHGSRIFIGAINVGSPLACVWFAVQTKRADIEKLEFTSHTTTIRSVSAAWVGFFVLACVDQATSFDVTPQLNDLYVLAAFTSLLALAGPAYSELAKARMLGRNGPAASELVTSAS